MSSAQEFARLLRDARRKAGLSLADLGSKTYTSRSWIANVEAGRRWPERAWVERAEREVELHGQLLTHWDKAEASRHAAKRQRALLASSAREAKLILAADPDAVDLDELQQSVIALSVDYLSTSPAVMLDRTSPVWDELTRRLREGAARPHQIVDLYLAVGRAAGILSYAALDLDQPDLAATYAAAAERAACAAGHDAMRSWARGTEALIARFEKNFNLSENLILDGLHHSSHGTSAVRLLCGLAQTYANLGNATGALGGIEAARMARETARPDEVEGLFGFSPAKQAYYTGSALMWLDDPRALTIAAANAQLAIKTWETESVEQRSLDDETLAHIYLGIARARLDELDGAYDAVQPVLALPAERRISWTRRRIGDLADVIETRFRTHPALSELRQYQSEDLI